MPCELINSYYLIVILGSDKNDFDSLIWVNVLLIVKKALKRAGNIINAL